MLDDGGLIIKAEELNRVIKGRFEIE